MALRAITAKEAKKITIETGYCWTPDGAKTYYAVREEDNGIFEYDTKAKRDNAVNKSRRESK